MAMGTAKSTVTATEKATATPTAAATAITNPMGVKKTMATTNLKPMVTTVKPATEAETVARPPLMVHHPTHPSERLIHQTHWTPSQKKTNRTTTNK